MDDKDGDALTNLQEYAFGTDPTVSAGAPITYEPGENVTNPGIPALVNLSVGEEAEYHAVFGQRKNHQAAGLTYTVQFSADLAAWAISSAIPSVLTGPGSSSEIEAVSVPYPQLIPVDGGHKKPIFFRVGVSGN